MNYSEERGRVAKDRVLSHEKQVEMARVLKEKGYSNSSIAHTMRIRENTVRILLEPR